MSFRITVFGGSQTQPGDPDYQQAYLLGSLIGQAGYTVLTGGYIGAMEAVSQGASKTGGYVIGVTCDEIEAWRPVKPNSWLMEEIRYPTLHQRLYALMENCDAAFALPGGVGTLTEISLMWNLLLTEAIPPRPLIAIGSGWYAVIAQLYATHGSYIPPAQRQWLHHAPDVKNGFSYLQEMLTSGKV